MDYVQCLGGWKGRATLNAYYARSHLQNNWDELLLASPTGSADAVALVKTLRANATTILGDYELALEDLVVTEVPKSGWMVASHDGESVALDLELTPTLIASGNIREVIRAIQERRKSDGFDISDRINVIWNSDAESVATIESGISHISEEVLATSMERDTSMPVSDLELGLVFKLSKA